MPRIKQRTPELRDHLLQVAMELLAEQGISALTTRNLAREAQTSAPAVYELFGDKAGLVREIFFEGFRLLRRRFEVPEPSPSPRRPSPRETSPEASATGSPAKLDPRAELVAALEAIRAFVRDHPVLADVMFSRPFADFDPGPLEEAAGASVRLFIVGRVQRCIDAGVLHGDATDIAQVLVALTRGLASTELAGWLGRSKASVDRRWTLGIDGLLAGLARGRIA